MIDRRQGAVALANPFSKDRRRLAPLTHHAR
jgi:hypothetical protein